MGRYWDHLKHVQAVIGCRTGVGGLSGVSLLILPQGTYFIVDTHVSLDPSADELVEMVELASHEVSGIRPGSEGGVPVAFPVRIDGRALGVENAGGRASAVPAPSRPGG
ncbi:phosphate acyltransferase [Oceanibaculum nanhaiense]|uniref:phosphate acyltransferase n=1 Tax=Oceanibaculum nanhaiense TaxID=1909734 RepID=UPI003D267578